jgi:hypothetical protein
MNNQHPENVMNTRPPSNSRPNLHSVPHPEEQGASARLRRALKRAMSGRRLRLRPTLRALVLEQLVMGGERTADTVSYAENAVSSLGKAAGDRVLLATQRDLDPLAKKSDGMRSVQAGLRVRADYRDDELVPHPDGGVRTVAEIAAEQDELREQIAEEIRNGSRKHQRLAMALRQVPALVITGDALLLLYFFSGITNVDWARPFSSALLFAVLLAGMVTGISFAFFRFTGDRLHQYKDETGTIPLRGLDTPTNISMGLAAGAMAILAALMFLRMHTEVSQALGVHSGTTATILGVTLAVVSVLANTLVVAVHSLDGSPEADRLEQLGRAIYVPLSIQHGFREQADTLEHEIAVVGRQADRVATQGRTVAGHRVAEYERAIDAARAIHQGTGPLSDSAVDPNEQDGVHGYRDAEATPRADERSLDLILGHIHTELGEDHPHLRPVGEDPDSGREQPAA